MSGKRISGPRHVTVGRRPQPRIARYSGPARSILSIRLSSFISLKKSGTALDSDAQNGREAPRFGFPGCCNC
jgi:hypothetical protein